MKQSFIFITTSLKKTIVFFQLCSIVGNEKSYIESIYFPLRYHFSYMKSYMLPAGQAQFEQSVPEILLSWWHTGLLPRAYPTMFILYNTGSGSPLIV